MKRRLRLVWRPGARRDLVAIVSYIARHNPPAARRIKKLIEAAVLPPSDHSLLFPEGRVPGTHEIVVHPNYIIVYRVVGDQVEIVSVIHARQQYP